MTAEENPFGRERATRLSDEETSERMLSTGIRRVEAEGLRVSFDLLRYEELIVEAGVARSAVYRRWPTKHHYYADLLRELAKHEFHAASLYQHHTLGMLQQMSDTLVEQLATQLGRHRIAAELCRVGGAGNFLTLSQSRQWRVWLTLTATLASLPENELQADLRASMRASETAFFTDIARMFDKMMAVLGYRHRVGLPEDLSQESVIQLAASLLEGMALHEMANPDTADTHWQADPFGLGMVAEWTLPGLGFATLLLNMFEATEQDAGDWPAEKVAERARMMEELMEELARS